MGLHPVAVGSLGTELLMLRDIIVENGAEGNHRRRLSTGNDLGGRTPRISVHLKNRYGVPIAPVFMNERAELGDNLLCVFLEDDSRNGMSNVRPRIEGLDQIRFNILHRLVCQIRIGNPSDVGRVLLVQGPCHVLLVNGPHRRVIPFADLSKHSLGYERPPDAGTLVLQPFQDSCVDLCFGSFYLTGVYAKGRTDLLYTQYRELVMAGKVCCHVRTTRELVEELRHAEPDNGFVSPVIASASKADPYHLFWDDIDKLKITDFKTEVLFDLVDSLYRQKHGLTVTGNYSMRDLVEQERMHPAIVRRLDDMCRVIEV